MNESRLKDALRWCLLYMTDCNGDLRSAEGRRLTPPPQIAATFKSAYDANFKKPQSDRGAEAEHLHWCACRIGKACNCRNVTAGDARAE